MDFRKLFGRAKRSRAAAHESSKNVSLVSRVRGMGSKFTGWLKAEKTPDSSDSSDDDQNLPTPAKRSRKTSSNKNTDHTESNNDNETFIISEDIVEGPAGEPSDRDHTEPSTSGWTRKRKICVTNSFKNGVGLKTESSGSESSSSGGNEPKDDRLPINTHSIASRRKSIFVPSEPTENDNTSLSQSHVDTKRKSIFVKSYLAENDNTSFSQSRVVTRRESILVTSYLAENDNTSLSRSPVKRSIATGSGNDTTSYDTSNNQTTQNDTTKNDTNNTTNNDDKLQNPSGRSRMRPRTPKNIGSFILLGGDDTDKNTSKNANSSRELSRRELQQPQFRPMQLSPFYPSPTIYGGASSSTYIARPKSKNTSGASGNTSRITDALEDLYHYSGIRPQYKANTEEPSSVVDLGSSTRNVCSMLESHQTPSVSSPFKTSSTRKDTPSDNPYMLRMPDKAAMLQLKQREQFMKTNRVVRQVMASLSSTQAQPSTTPPSGSSCFSKEYHDKPDVRPPALGKTRSRSKAFEQLPETVSLPSGVLRVDQLPVFDIPKPTPAGATNSGTSQPSPVSFRYSFASPGMVSPDMEPPLITEYDSLTHSSLCSEAELGDSANNSSAPAPLPVSAEPPIPAPLAAFSNKLEEKQWKCDVCWIMNKNEAEKCVACAATKRGLKKTVPDPNMPLAAKKPDVVQWKCDDCWIKNKSDLEKCVACGAAKPGSKKTVPAPNMPLAAKKPDVVQWKCDDCWIMNKQEADKCVACGASKPGASKQSAPSAGTAPPLDDVFAAVVRAQKSKWQCSSCLTSNDTDKARCQCCDMEREGPSKELTPKPFNFPKESNTTFKFGIDPKQQEQSIAKKKEEKAKPMPAKSETAKDSGVEAAKTGDNEAKDVKTSNTELKFSFGIPKTTTETPAVSTHEPAGSKGPVLSTSFTFAPKSTNGPSQSTGDKPLFSLPYASSSSAPSGTAAAPSSLAAASTPTPALGPAPTPVFAPPPAAPATTLAAAPAATAVQSTVAPASAPLFSFKSESAGSAPSTGMFSFGNKSSASSAFSNEKKSPFGGFTLGAPSTSGDSGPCGAGSTPAFTFGTSSTATPFSTPASAQPASAPAFSAAAQSTPTPAFSAAAHSAPTPAFPAAAQSASTPAFPAAAQSAPTPAFPAAAQTPTFNAPAQNPQPPFGASLFAANVKPPPVVFGATTQNQTSTFGAPSQSQAFGGFTQTQTSGFGNQPFQNQGGFGSSTQTPAPAAFGGSGATQSSVFGSNATQPPVFGGNNTNQPSVFGANNATQPLAFGAGANPSSGFGAGAASQTSGFGAGVASQSSGFGVGAANQSSGFGAGATSQLSGFGAGASSQVSGFGAGAANPPSGFGASSTSQPFGAAPASQPFGASAVNQPTAFGASSAPQPAVFGASSPSQPATFGASSGQTSMFGAGAVASFAAPPTQPPAFSLPTQKPAASNPMFNFSGSTQPVFGFGQQGAASSGGAFNFSGANMGAQSMEPSLGGVQFSVGSAPAGTAGQRRMRKAVRRTQPR